MRRKKKDPEFPTRIVLGSNGLECVSVEHRSPRGHVYKRKRTRRSPRLSIELGRSTIGHLLRNKP